LRGVLDETPDDKWATLAPKQSHTTCLLQLFTKSVLQVHADIKTQYGRRKSMVGQERRASFPVRNRPYASSKPLENVIGCGHFDQSLCADFSREYTPFVAIFLSPAAAMA